MAITEADINEMLAFLLTHPEYQDRFRAITTAPGMATIPSRMDHVEAAILALTQETTRLSETVTRLAEEQVQLVAVTDRLAEEHSQLVAVTERLAEQSTRLGTEAAKTNGIVSNLKGSMLESKYEDNIDNWFGEYVVSPAKVSIRRLPGFRDAEREGTISSQEAIAVKALDMVVRGTDEDSGEDVYLAVEVSNVVDESDVSRVVERALILRRLGLQARAFVGGHVITAEAERRARQHGVIVDLHESSR